ncbi:hypothetical protein ILYODFUR_017671 [Ilyodon furcidens]|uniref:Uncharacterized protein n=1 Tax=Ilyodon furcidens TaxID=33524 RepID=A0ABV0V670_9TELE
MGSGGGSVMVWGDISHSLEKQGSLSLKAILVERDIKTRFCNQWESHIFILQDVTARCHRVGFIRDFNCLSAVLTSTQVTTCGTSLGFVPERPTQPHWLTCDKCLLRYGLPSHGSVCPSWCPV